MKRSQEPYLGPLFARSPQSKAVGLFLLPETLTLGETEGRVTEGESGQGRLPGCETWEDEPVKEENGSGEEPPRQTEQHAGVRNRHGRFSQEQQDPSGPAGSSWRGSRAR